MKKTYLYLIVVLVIVVIVALGWYFFSSQGAFTMVNTQYCPSGQSSIRCDDTTNGGPFSGFLNCTGSGVSCSNSYKGLCFPSTGFGSGKYLQCGYEGGGGGGGGRHWLI